MVNVFDGGKTPALAASDLESMGYRLGIYPSQAHRAAIHASQVVLAELHRHGTTAAVSDQMISFSEREEIVGTARWHHLEEQYLHDPTIGERREQSGATGDR